MPKETFFNLAQDKREHILEIAIHEFAEHGYKSASISRMVANAGIAKGSFYQYFKDKNDLFLHLVTLATEQKQAFFTQFDPPSAELGTFSYLRWAFSKRIEFEVANPKLNKIGYIAVYGDYPHRDEIMALGQAEAAKFTQNLFARGRAAGDLDPDLDGPLAMFIFNSVFLHLADYLLERLGIEKESLVDERPFLFDSPEATEIFDGIMNILQHGMGGKS